MTDFWNFDHLERVTGGLWLIAPGPDHPPPHGLTHDTRTLTAGQAYLAIAGQNHDGRDFLAQAAAAGAALCIVPEDDADENEDFTLLRRRLPAGFSLPTLVVEDTVEALQELGSAHRDALDRSGCKVLAVAGSNGKTTTRHLLHHVLTAAGLRGTQSPKSFNNHLGVPLTLLAASPDDDFVACEIGTNHPGEIAALGQLVWPDAALITSIGREHLEHFGSLEGVAREEAALLPFVRASGLVATPAPAAAALMPHYDVQEHVTLLPIRDDAGVPDDLPLLGQHNRLNAALVLAVARWLGIDESKAVAALRTAKPPPGRLNCIPLSRGVTLIDDTYNANPDSMAAALELLEQLPYGSHHDHGGRKIAVLGEMRELGEHAKEAHAQVGRLADDAADVVHLLGSAYSSETSPSASPPFGDDLENFQITAALIASQIQPGDTVLLKASRGVGLERMIPFIQSQFPPDPDHPTDQPDVAST